MKAIENISEATKKIPQNIKRQDPNIPWQKITNIRNRMVHQYEPALACPVKVIAQPVREAVATSRHKVREFELLSPKIDKDPSNPDLEHAAVGDDRPGGPIPYAGVVEEAQPVIHCLVYRRHDRKAPVPDAERGTVTEAASYPRTDPPERNGDPIPEGPVDGAFPNGTRAWARTCRIRQVP